MNNDSNARGQIDRVAGPLSQQTNPPNRPRGQPFGKKRARAERSLPTPGSDGRFGEKSAGRVADGRRTGASAALPFGARRF
jgi:hypothetical protein